MILQRNIVYIMTLISIVSFVGLLSTCSTLVNVCSGLLSGAIIGILTSMTQYFRIRGEYLTNLLIQLKDFYRVFVVDEELLYKSITFLREHNFKEVQACKGFKDFDEVNNDIIERYTALPATCNYAEYVSINPFDKKSKKMLKSIDFEIAFARGELIKFHSELLDVKDAESSGDLDDCLYSRTLLYEALASGIQNMYVDAESISKRCNLQNTQEYKSWLQYADDAYTAIVENEEYAILGNKIDESEDEDEEFEYQ